MTTSDATTLYIDGSWVASSDGATRTVTCPADGTEVGVVSEATADDVERAIARCARAPSTTACGQTGRASERGDFLLQVADGITARKDDFARAGGPGHRQATGRGRRRHGRHRLRVPLLREDR